MRSERTSSYAKLDSRLSQWFLRNPLGAVTSHWLFQSLIYMDGSERCFKIGIDLILTVLGTLMLNSWLGWPTALMLAFLIAHSVNFLFNGHMWGALKHYGLVTNSYEAFQSYAEQFATRASQEPAIERCLVYGSLSHDQWTHSSDLDVRLIRQSGFFNGWRACWFALCERSRALVARFPIDIYVIDTKSSLERMSAREVPIDMLAQTDHSLPVPIQAERSSVSSIVLTALGELALLLFCLMPGLFFSHQTIQEPWTMFRIARASMSMNTGHILAFVTSGAGYRSEHIGGEMLQVALLSATQWPLEAIGLLPIGSLLIAILFYTAARLVSRTRWAAIAITLFASWYYPGLYSQFGTETYAWTHSLFLTFLILYLLWLRNRTAIVSILIMLIFTATFLHYHTTPLWVIVALSIGIMALRHLNSHKSQQTPISWAIALFCIVLYFSFDTVFYGNGLARISSEATSESFIQSFLSKIIAPLFAHAPELRPFEIAPINPRLATWTTLLVLLSLTVPVGVWCIRKLVLALSSRSLSALAQEPDDIFVWGVIGVAIAHMLIYSTYGAVSIRVIPLAFPLLLPIVVRMFRSAIRIEMVLTSTLAVCAVVGFLSIAPTLHPDTTASETGMASKLLVPERRVLAGANVYGSLLLNTAEDGHLLDFTWVDSDIYMAVTGRKSIDWNTFDYLAIDMSNKPIISSSWVFYEPWAQHVSEISQNGQLDKIYDSENLMLFSKHGSELPHYQPALTNLDASSRNAFVDTISVLFAVISLFFFPGLAIVTILHLGFQGIKFTWYLILSLSIGLSIVIVTFVGYLVNFTSLGLDWLVPLVIGLPLVVLASYLLYKRPHFRLPLAWKLRSVVILVVIIGWALFATQVAAARVQRHAEYTEFFATQESAKTGTVLLHIVNRWDKPISYSITIEQGTSVIQVLRPTIVEPHTTLLATWEATSERADQPVSIVLRQDGTAYRNLLFRDIQRSILQLSGESQ